SAKFNETLQSIVEGLKASGFSGNEHRVSDKMTEEEKQTAVVNPVENFLFPEQQTETEEEIDNNRISFDANASEEEMEENPFIQEMDAISKEQNNELEQQIQEQE